jgi:hypothetical protein
MVRRAVLTGRGPVGLLAWLRARLGGRPVREPSERFVLALTAELLQILRDPRGPAPGAAGRG